MNKIKVALPLLLIAFLLFLKAPFVKAEGAEGIQIEDETLRSTIIETLELSTSVITENDMKRLEVLDTPINDPARQITSITGLEYAVNLKELNLDYNKITDLSPISNLKKLEKLNISYNKELESISCLSGLTNLTYFSSIGNELNYSIVSNFDKLKYLNVSISKQTSIDYVSNLTNLESLYIAFNQIDDISALGNLVNLKTLAINDNKVESIESIKRLSQLEGLYLQNNYIQDFSMLVDLGNLKIVDVSRNFLSDSDAELLNERLTYVETLYFMPKKTLATNENFITLDEIGSTFELTVEGTEIDQCSFVSSDNNVATVNAGVITAVKEGNAIITISWNGFTHKIYVRVEKEPTNPDTNPTTTTTTNTTTNPDTNPTTSQTTKNGRKGGCRSSLSSLGLITLSLSIFTAVIVYKRKKDEK